jgi:hypothetical protein
MNRENGILFGMVLTLLCSFSSIQFTLAQSSIHNAHGWQLQDYRTDSVFGAGINRAYNSLLKGKNPDLLLWP